MSTPADQLNLSSFPQPQLLGQGAPAQPGAYPGLSQYFQAPPQLPTTAAAPPTPQAPQQQQPPPLAAPTGRTTTPISQELAALDRRIPALQAQDAAGAQGGGYGGLPGAGLGLTPTEQKAQEAVFGAVTPVAESFAQQAQQAAKDFPAYANKIGALAVQRDKAIAEQDAKTAQYDEQLAQYQLEAAGKERDIDAALTKWATQTPTRQATYAASLHISPLLSILAAVGGAATKTNAIGLLQATNGVVQGVNSGNEINYVAAVEEWDRRKQALQDHQQRVADIYKQYQEAYKGMADASERAAARTRVASGEQMQTAQLKMMPSLTAMEAQGKILNELANPMKAFAAIYAARTRGYFGGMQMGEGLPPGWTQEMIDRYAERAYRGDYSWRTGLSRTAYGSWIISSIDRRAAELHPEISPGEWSTVGPQQKALSASLTEQTKYLTGVERAVDQFNRQIATVNKYVQPGTAGPSPILNRWIQAGRKSIVGDAQVNELDAALVAAAREHARIISGPMSNAQLHQGAVDRNDALLNRDMNADAILGTLAEMQQEGMNFIGANRDEATRIRQRMAALGQAPAPAVPEEVQQTPIPGVTPPAAGATTQQQQTAPPQAIEYLRQHPEFREQFRQKYGYLPQ
jgi:hypothetical protein